MFGQGSFFTTGNFRSNPQVGTFAQRTAIASPGNGDQFLQTNDDRDSPAGFYYFLSPNWNYVPLNPEQLIRIFDDLFLIGGNGVAASNFLWSITGSATPTGLFNNTQGTVTLSTAASGTGRVTMYQGSLNNSATGLFFTGGFMYYKVFVVDFPTLSAVAEEYILRFGLGQFGGGGLGGDLDNGVYFEYNRLVSTFWTIRRAVAGVRSTAITTTPVATGTNLVFEITVNAAGTLAEYFLNGVSIGTVASVANSMFGNPFFQIVKSAGVTPRVITLDYVKAFQRRTTTRS